MNGQWNVNVVGEVDPYVMQTRKLFFWPWRLYFRSGNLFLIWTKMAADREIFSCYEQKWRQIRKSFPVVQPQNQRTENLSSWGSMGGRKTSCILTSFLDWYLDENSIALITTVAFELIYAIYSKFKIIMIIYYLNHEIIICSKKS